MLELLKLAMQTAPNGCKVNVVFHDNDKLDKSTIVAADNIGIVIESTERRVLHRMVPWTAIAILDVEQY